ITSPGNPRFAPVVANRLWKRHLGAGLVEPVDDWDSSPTETDPELLDALGRELMTHDYSLKHLARLILSSRVYQARVDPSASPASSPTTTPAPPAPARRRMSAEQLLDSI